MEEPNEVDAAVEDTKEIADPAAAPPEIKKLAGRRLQRMVVESRYRVFPPGSSWKRRDGTTAKAGPRYGAPLPKPVPLGG